jgi:hypothetical protein
MVPRLLQNPDDLKLPVAACLRILPCGNCGSSMLASPASATDKNGKPLCTDCGIEQVIRELRSS